MLRLGRLAAVSCKRTSTIVGRLSKVTVPSRTVPSGFVSIRKYSDYAPNDDETQRLNKLVTELKSNPKISEALEELQQLLVLKGFDPSTKPSMMKMMLILMDKEIKASITALKTQLEEAKISFSKEDVDTFMKLFGLNMK